MNYSCPLSALSTPDRAWDQSTAKEWRQSWWLPFFPASRGSSCQTQASISNAQMTIFVHICAVARRAHTPQWAALDPCSWLPVWGASTAKWGHWWDEVSSVEGHQNGRGAGAFPSCMFWHWMGTVLQSNRRPITAVYLQRPTSVAQIGSLWKEVKNLKLILFCFLVMHLTEDNSGQKTLCAH